MKCVFSPSLHLREEIMNLHTVVTHAVRHLSERHRSYVSLRWPQLRQ